MTYGEPPSAEAFAKSAKSTNGWDFWGRHTAESRTPLKSLCDDLICAERCQRTDVLPAR